MWTQTGYARKFFEADMPSMVKSLAEISKSLKEINETLNKELKKD